jgi:putative modified peptide
MVYTRPGATAHEESRGIAMSETLTPELADRLLDQLSQDDGFRDLFRKDPRAALAQVGLDTSGTDGAWQCLQVKDLASKEAIRAARDELRKQLVFGMGFNPHRLESQK